MFLSLFQSLISGLLISGLPLTLQAGFVFSFSVLCALGNGFRFSILAGPLQKCCLSLSVRTLVWTLRHTGDLFSSRVLKPGGSRSCGGWKEGL